MTALVKDQDHFQRLNFLYQAAHCVLAQNPDNEELARFYIHTGRNICKRLVLRQDPSVKRTICKKCSSLLVPGVTSSVRQRRWSRKRRATVVRCLYCGLSKTFINNPNHKLWCEQMEARLENQPGTAQPTAKEQKQQSTKHIASSKTVPKQRVLENAVPSAENEQGTVQGFLTATRDKVEYQNTGKAPKETCIQEQKTEVTESPCTKFPLSGQPVNIVMDHANTCGKLLKESNEIVVHEFSAACQHILGVVADETDVCGIQIEKGPKPAELCQLSPVDQHDDIADQCSVTDQNDHVVQLHSEIIPHPSHDGRHTPPSSLVSKEALQKRLQEETQHLKIQSQTLESTATSYIVLQDTLNTGFSNLQQTISTSIASLEQTLSSGLAHIAEALSQNAMAVKDVADVCHTFSVVQYGTVSDKSTSIVEPGSSGLQTPRSAVAHFKHTSSGSSPVKLPRGRNSMKTTPVPPEAAIETSPVSEWMSRLRPTAARSASTAPPGGQVAGRLQQDSA